MNYSANYKQVGPLISFYSLCHLENQSFWYGLKSKLMTHGSKKLIGFSCNYNFVIKIWKTGKLWVAETNLTQTLPLL